MNRPKILIDPGHNKANYNQSPVVPEYWEGKQMWKLYQFLRPALEAKGFEVGCTKSKCDQAVTVTQRGAMVRGYLCVVSLHSNACGTESVDRPEGIYFVDDDCGVIDEKSKQLASRMSKVVAEVMGTSDAWQYSKLSSRDRDLDGKRNDDYYGLLFAAHQAGGVAIILEHSFHTNKKAAQWLLSDANLKKLAEAEADELAEIYAAELEAASATTTNKKEGTPVRMTTLREGSKHPHVKIMQMLLIGNGYSCGSKGADGSFGPATKKALGKYQEDHEDADGKPLDVDHVCGPKCWGSLLAQ